MFEQRLQPIARGNYLKNSINNALTRAPQVILASQLPGSRRHAIEHVKTFNRPELHFVPKRRADYYPMPGEASCFFGHASASYCNAYIQEISPYQMKNMWSFYMHSLGRFWYRFAVAWWTWVWPSTMFLFSIFGFAYRNQRIQRVRTWN